MPRNVNTVDISREAGLDAALALLHFGFRAVVEEADRLLARRGFGRAHHRILFFIGHAQPLPMFELLAILGVTRQALHRPLSELIDQGYVSSKPSPKSRRVCLLSLTAKGRQFEETLSGLQRDRFAAVFRQLGPAAEKNWRAVMKALAGSLVNETTAGFVAGNS